MFLAGKVAVRPDGRSRRKGRGAGSVEWFQILPERYCRASLRITLDASAAPPIINPAILIRNWGDGDATLQVNGKTVQWGASYSVGHIEHLDRTGLILWIRAESTQPFRAEVRPAKR